MEEISLSTCHTQPNLHHYSWVLGATIISHNVCPVHTHTTSVKSYLHPSARVARLENASIFNHTVFRNPIPFNPMTLVLPLRIKEKVFPSSSLKSDLISCLKGTAFFFSGKNISLFYGFMRKS